MQNKRFIAGALCPACKQLDKIFTYSKLDEKWRACVHCDFNELFEEKVRRSADELPTRVNQHRVGEQALQHETPTEPVVLVDIKKT
jgi:uncharacterized metal-binding protein (TIGR02443 family)